MHSLDRTISSLQNAVTAPLYATTSGAALVHLATSTSGDVGLQHHHGNNHRDREREKLSPRASSIHSGGAIPRRFSNEHDSTLHLHPPLGSPPAFHTEAVYSHRNVWCRHRSEVLITLITVIIGISAALCLNRKGVSTSWWWLPHLCWVMGTALSFCLRAYHNLRFETVLVEELRHAVTKTFDDSTDFTLSTFHPLIAHLQSLVLSALHNAQQQTQPCASQARRPSPPPHEFEQLLRQQGALIIPHTNSAIEALQEELAVWKNAEEGVIVTDKFGTILWCNAALSSTLGYGEPEELVESNISILLPEPYCRYHDLCVQSTLRQGKLCVLATAKHEIPLRAEDGRIVFAVADITEKTRESSRTVSYIARFRFRASDGILQAFARDVGSGACSFAVACEHFRNTGKCVCITNISGTILFASDAFTVLLRHLPTDVIGSNIKCYMEDSIRKVHDVYVNNYRERAVAQETSAASVELHKRGGGGGGGGCPVLHHQQSASSLITMGSAVGSGVDGLSRVVGSGREVRLVARGGAVLSVFMTLDRVDRTDHRVDDCLMVATFTAANYKQGHHQPHLQPMPISMTPSMLVQRMNSTSSRRLNVSRTIVSSCSSAPSSSRPGTAASSGGGGDVQAYPSVTTAQLSGTSAWPFMSSDGTQSQNLPSPAPRSESCATPSAGSAVACKSNNSGGSGASETQSQSCASTPRERAYSVEGTVVTRTATAVVPSSLPGRISDDRTSSSFTTMTASTTPASVRRASTILAAGLPTPRAVPDLADVWGSVSSTASGALHPPGVFPSPELSPAPVVATAMPTIPQPVNVVSKTNHSPPQKANPHVTLQSPPLRQHHSPPMRHPSSPTTATGSRIQPLVLPPPPAPLHPPSYHNPLTSFARAGAKPTIRTSTTSIPSALASPRGSGGDEGGKEASNPFRTASGGGQSHPGAQSYASVASTKLTDVTSIASTIIRPDTSLAYSPTRAVRGSLTNGTLVERVCTLLAVRLSGLLAAIHRLKTPDQRLQFGTLCTEFLNVVSATAQKNRGEAILVSGEIVFVSFNLRHANASHVRAAVEVQDALWASWKDRFAAEFAATLQPQPVVGMGLNMAIASGSVFTAPSFTCEVLLSPLADTVGGMTDVARECGATCVIDDTVFQTVEYTFLTRPLNMMSFVVGGETKSFTLYELCERKNMCENEWMYGIMGCDRYSEWREMFTNLLLVDNPNIPAVVAVLTKYVAANPSDSVARWMKQVLDPEGSLSSAAGPGIASENALSVLSSYERPISLLCRKPRSVNAGGGGAAICASFVSSLS